MNKIQKLSIAMLALGAVALFAAPSFSAEKEKAPAKEAAKAAPAEKSDKLELVSKNWAKRCEKDNSNCEVFKRVDVKDKNLRVAEFAISQAKGKDAKKGMARGVAVLPLGTMLPVGFAMKIDDQEPVLLKPLYCIQEGCVSVIDLNKDTVNTLKKAKTTAFLFQTAEGKTMRLPLDMQGFDAAWKELN